MGGVKYIRLWGEVRGWRMGYNLKLTDMWYSKKTYNIGLNHSIRLTYMMSDTTLVYFLFISNLCI